MSDFPPIPEDGRILFYRRDRPEFGFLSHFYPSPIVVDGMEWASVEHFYQAHKSLDPRYFAAVRAAATASEAKRLATVPAPGGKDRGSWFTGARRPREDWGDVKLDLMRKGDAAKYAQNPALAARLRATGDAELVEDSESDAFWGIGKDGRGGNWAGRVLMEVRAGLPAEAA